MKRIVILVLAAMMAGLCACSAQTVWETVGGGCVRESDGASSVICVRLPQDAVEEVFAEAGTQHVYTQPGGGYEIVTQVLPAASMQSVVRSLSGFDASALRVYESGSLQPAGLAVRVVRRVRRGRAAVPLQGHLGGRALLRADLQRAGGLRHRL